MKSAIVFLADGFEETEALAPVDMLRRAGIDVTLASISSSKLVASSHKVRIEADIIIDQAAEHYDLVFCPGGMPGTTNLAASDAVRKYVVETNQRGDICAAICAGPMVLGNAGVLQGKEATCFPGFEKYLTGATLKDGKVVVSGNCITAVGAAASIELGLAMVEALVGKEKAEEVATQIQTYHK